MDDLDRYIDGRFGKSGEEREAFDEGRQEFMREVIEAVEVDAETQSKMDSIADRWSRLKNSDS